MPGPVLTHMTRPPVKNNLTSDYVIQDVSGSNEQFTDPNGVPLTVQDGGAKAIGAPLMRLTSRGPINLRGRAGDSAYKITLG